MPRHPLAILLSLRESKNLVRLPENLGNAESLELLDLSKTAIAIRNVPPSIGLLKKILNCGMRPSLFIQCQEVLIQWSCQLSSLSGACSLSELN